MSRLVQPCRREDVHYAFRGYPAGKLSDEPPGQVLFRARLSRRSLGQCRSHCLEEPHIVSNAEGFCVRHSQGKGLGEFTDCSHTTVLAAFLGQEVLLCGREQPQTLCWCASGPL